MVDIIDKPDDSHNYSQLATKIAAAFNKKYFDSKTNLYEGGTQTANLVPLNFGLTLQNSKEAVVKNLLANIESRDWHLSTGFIGTAIILPVLTAVGHHDIAYRLACQKTYPSWGYMVEQGATTIWELWDSDKQGAGMNSRNHFCFGTIGQWFYESLGGINPDSDHPGYKRSIIRPLPVGDLTWVNSRIETLYGPLASNWSLDDDGFTLKVTIPNNTSATVYIPFGRDGTVRENGTTVLKNGLAAEESDGVAFIGLENDRAVFEVGSGEYEFSSDF